MRSNEALQNDVYTYCTVHACNVSTLENSAIVCDLVPRSIGNLGEDLGMRLIMMGSHMTWGSHLIDACVHLG